MSINAQFLKQKGPGFWLLHVVLAAGPLALACFLLTSLGFGVWITGAAVLVVGGFFYHRHSSSVAAQEAFRRIGDVRAMMAEQKAIEMAAMLLSSDAAEASRDIRSTRGELIQRFAAAAPHIRSAWLWLSVLPSFLVFGGFAWWFWSSEARHAISVPVAIVISFILMTAQFFLRSPLMAAEGFAALWEERGKR